MSGKEYYLGLDMGVSSVGWAVTDRNYNLLRAKGKDLWGIREFDEAQTAERRRSHRINRRRRQREIVRIGLLKDYFHDAINEKDPGFYQRLDNSKYYLEDKDENVRSKNGIFNDDKYQDKEYYEEFPTIFHLRKELIYNPEEHDVRLVYLALLNMFKHRGHFLNGGLSDEGDVRKIDEIYKELCLAIREETGEFLDESIDDSLIEEVLTNRDYSRSKKAEELRKILEINSKEKQKTEYVKAICGLKVSLQRLFTECVLDNDKKVEFCFGDSDFEEKEQEIKEVVGEELFNIVALMKELYDTATLNNIMKGYVYLSDARVAEYEKHKNDLAILKGIMKTYKSTKEYNELFRSDREGSYSAYVNSINSGTKSRRNMKGRKREDLYKTINRLLKDLPEDDEQVIYVLEEIKKETFLPKQLTSSNGIIPNQLHTREMKKILENAERYLYFLSEKDESGFTVSERIIKLFSFQVPYYIGPTSEKSKTGWVVRKETGPVLPWNMERKIDVKETSEKFISRMVRRCSYINGEMVLPKASLEYESFCVLNEINNISINGERISVELKQGLYNDLFKKGKKVTRKQIVNYLRAQGALEEENQLSGIDIAINNSLSTYGKFKAILGEKIEEDRVKRMVEEVVFWCTIYGDSKKLLKEKIEEKYADEFSQAEIKRILGYKFKDWGRLSKEFLELPGCDTSIGENVSLIRMLWNENLNLMELINSPNYTYGQELENKQTKVMKTLSEMQPEDLDEYNFSAPVRRMVWQTLLIIKELEGILGSQPVKLFVEMAREADAKKTRSISRKNKFLELYKSLKNDTVDWKGEIEKADENGTLRSKKMYLYFTQMGRCMYTGETISIENLFNDNLYDIDHIYPRHFVKDDNIDNNLVLVKKEVNAHKSDEYPIESAIYEKQIDMWKALYGRKMITEEKYRRLTGRNGFTDEQKADFIARQLVETRQGTKAVSELLKHVLPDTALVYSKASNVSRFRDNRDIVKCRSVNDFHHAQDAYLNIVVGNVYHVKFTQNPLNFIRKEYSEDMKKNHYNLSRMFDWDVRRGDEVAWIGPKKDGDQGTIVTVKKVLAKNTPIMTRRNYEAHGAIANETLYGKKKASPENYIPLKSNDEKMTDVKKYGGYTSASTAYFFLVEHTEKKKRVRTLETVPIYMAEKIKDNEEALLNYCREELGLADAEICMPKIKIQSLIKKDGYFAHISGKTGNRIILRNAVNLCLKDEWIKYIKKIEKYMDSDILNKEINKEKNEGVYIQLIEKFNNGIYSKRPNPIGEKLVIKQEIFKELDIKQQCKVLTEILKLTAIGTSTADLSLLKEGTSSGIMRMSKRISDIQKIELVNQSITGVFEKYINLLTV